MNNSKKPNNAIEMLNNLLNFIQEDEKEIWETPLPEVNKELAEEGIMISDFISKIKSEISKIEAKEIIKNARDKKAELLLKQSLINDKKTTFSNMTELLKQIKKILNCSDQEVLAYCRKFKDKNETDIKTLLDDLSLLDKLDSNDKPGKS